MKEAEFLGYSTSMSDFLRPKEGVHALLILSSVVETIRQIAVVLGDVEQRRAELFATTRRKFGHVAAELLATHERLLAHEREYECSEGQGQRSASPALCELAMQLPNLLERTREAIDRIGEDVLGEPFDSQLGIVMREIDCALLLLRACGFEFECHGEGSTSSLL